MNRKALFLLLVVCIAVAISIPVSHVNEQREWFRIQAQQIDSFTSIERFPPEGLTPQSWRSEIITPINVWINATYHPSHSHLSTAEMTAMLTRIRAITSKATTENSIQNSIQSVDDVLTILTERDHMNAFVVGFREEFRSRFPSHFPSTL